MHPPSLVSQRASQPMAKSRAGESLVACLYQDASEWMSSRCLRVDWWLLAPEPRTILTHAACLFTQVPPPSTQGPKRIRKARPGVQGMARKILSNSEGPSPVRPYRTVMIMINLHLATTTQSNHLPTRRVQTYTYAVFATIYALHYEPDDICHGGGGVEWQLAPEPIDYNNWCDRRTSPSTGVSPCQSTSGTCPAFE